ncbi:50S ribosomal protein L3 [Candidatus Gottesmanbacteria bacterium]|nr:50S ribosomal protein L3 [Candidatus Gottesmanbacteria bacterium]
MVNALLGFKLSQSQTFTEDGKRIPVTLVQAGPCWVTQVTDMGSYRAIQIGFGNMKHPSKALLGHMKKAGLETKPRFLRTIRDSGQEEVKPGTEIKIADVFQIGDKVRVTGTSKGKGFAGVVKRHKFKGGPRTHGQSDRERAPGSIGQTTTPGRVYRGKRMAGHMGTATVTVLGLKVTAVDPTNNVLTIKGMIPGGKNALVLIAKDSR